MSNITVLNNAIKKYDGDDETYIIPDGVTSIAAGAFKGNKHLKRVYIPESVEYIGSRAFCSCTSLKEIKGGHNVKILDSYAFSGCTALEEISLLMNIRTVTFCLFKGCTNLKKVVIAEGVRKISKAAFSKCVSLESIELPSSLKVINDYAFSRCRKLKSVLFHSEDTKISTVAFNRCKADLVFNWPDKKTYKAEAESGFWVGEEGCLINYFGSNESVVIPNSVSKIGRFAFAENSSVKSLVLPENVHVIDDHGLSWMNEIEEVEMKGITYLGEGAFWADTNMKKVIFPNSLKQVGNDCFGHCRSLTELDFGNTEAVFNGRIAPMAYGLKHVVLPKCLKKLPANAFYYCESLEDIEVPDTISEIDDYAFVECKSLRKITIPEGVERIKLSIFDGCDSLMDLCLMGEKTEVNGMTDEFCTVVPYHFGENKPLVAVIFMGIQGSGKTYYYNWHYAGKYEHINLDELHTRNKESNEIQRCIEQKLNLVIDNTNPTRADRERYIPLLRASGYRIIGMFFESKLQDCIERNDQREGKAKLPAKAIAATSNRLEMPSKSEGFDELYFIERSGSTVMLKREWRE